nr:glycosyltransferase family 2 protein [Nostocaceae cyanobacterium]
DQRHKFNSTAFSNIVHNETLALLEHLSPLQLPVFFLWAVLVGTRDAFGLVQLLRLLPKERTLAWQKWLASIQGRWQGLRTWQLSNSPTIVQEQVLTLGEGE